MDYFAGTDILFTHKFVGEGEPFVPDPNTVKYTVYDHSGAPIAGLIDVPVATTSLTYQISFTIPAVNNSIGVGKNFERRTVVVMYQRGGADTRDVQSYRIIVMGLYSVEPKDVRSFIGIQEKELNDDEIDIYAAYMYVKQEFGDTIAIDTALTSGTTQELAVNELIKLRAVIDLIPSLRQRIAQEESNGVTSYKRLNIKDFNEFEAAVLGRYSAVMTEVLDLTGVDVTLVLTTTDADPITGA
jgi:hypothetical protein